VWDFKNFKILKVEGARVPMCTKFPRSHKKRLYVPTRKWQNIKITLMIQFLLFKIFIISFYRPHMVKVCLKFCISKYQGYIHAWIISFFFNFKMAFLRFLTNKCTYIHVPKFTPSSTPYLNFDTPSDPYYSSLIRIYLSLRCV
jgi:hypothetical protein